MKKVMHVISGLSTGGAEMMLYKLLDNRSQYEEFVVCLGEEKNTFVLDKINSLGVKVYFLNIGLKKNVIRSLFHLRAVVVDERPGIVHGWMYHGNLMSALVKLWFRNIVLIWNVRHSLHDLNKESRPIRWAIRLNKLFASIPEVVVYNSQTSARQHEEFGFPANKTQILPNGFDDQLFSPSRSGRKNARALLGVKPEDFVIGLVARFHAMKGHDFCLQAAKILQKKFEVEKFRLIFIGSGLDESNEAITALIDKYQLRSHVILLGERNNLHEYTRAFDIGTSASLGEGFSNSIGEAMSCAVPCVVTDVGDSAWIVGDSGEVVQPGDPLALAQAWLQVIDMNDSERRKLGALARQRITSRFAISQVAAMYSKLYSSLLAADY